MAKPICHFLIGLPGSGKSTWAAKQNMEIVSTDAYIEERASAEGKTYTEMFTSTIKHATDYMNNIARLYAIGHISFIWDQTNLTVSTRAKKLALLKDYQVWGHYWTTEMSEIMRRQTLRPNKVIPSHIMKAMEKGYEIPIFAEGFHSLTEHKD